MKALNRTLELIARQYRGFSPTARMLMASLMAILVLSLLLVVRFAGRPQMVPLGVDGDQDTRARVVTYLEANKIRHEARGDDILVADAEKLSILNRLASGEVIQMNAIDFDALVAEESPFTDRVTSRRRYMVLKMGLVSAMLSSIDGVDKAHVVIDEPEQRVGLGRGASKTTASVFVHPSTGQVSTVLATAIAQAVAGAESTLTLDRISIIDSATGRNVRPRTDDDLANGNHLEATARAERQYRDKIEYALSYIPGVIVSVNAQVDTDMVHSRSVTPEDPKIAPTRERSEEMVSEMMANTGQPGVVPNTGGQSVSRGRGTSSSLTKSDTENIPAFGYDEETRKEGYGEARRVDATVSIPRSYFEAVFLSRNGTADEPASAPDDATLAPIVADHSEKIEDVVSNLIRTDTVKGGVAGGVVVTMHDDNMSIGAPEFEAGVGPLGSTLAFMPDGVIKSVGLVALAVVSLMLMFMMVKRASKQEEMPSAEELVGIPPALAEAESDLVGEVDESDAAMEGLEVSEEEVRRQQMLEQINELASTAPDQAAGLLRKWVRMDDEG